MKQSSTRNSTKIVEKTVITPDVGKLPPQSRELEEAVLGALLLEKNAYEIVCGILKPESFYDPIHKIIFGAIQSLVAQNEPVDILTVVEELKRKGELELVGGAVYVAELSEKVASSAHIEHHARIVQQKYLSRKLIEIASQSLSSAYDETLDIDDVVSEALTAIENMQNGATEQQMKSISSVVYRAGKEYEKRAINAEKGISIGIHTGLERLDKRLYGFQRGELCILAGRPAMGKTAFALHIARKTAMRGNAVAIFSLEMTDISFANRMIIADSGIDAHAFRSGRLVPEELHSMMSSQGRIAKLPISINETLEITVNQIKAQCKKLKREGKCDIVLIDYLQLIEKNKLNGKTTNDELEALSRSLKAMAKELGLPVVVLCQLSRECERRSGSKKPMLSDLRGSGAIEQDADVVMFIHREHYYNDEADKNEATLIIAKNREGQTGELDIWVNDSISVFGDEKPYGFVPPPIAPQNFYEPKENEFNNENKGDLPF